MKICVIFWKTMSTIFGGPRYVIVSSVGHGKLLRWDYEVEVEESKCGSL